MLNISAGLFPALPLWSWGKLEALLSPDCQSAKQGPYSSFPTALQRMGVPTICMLERLPTNTTFSSVHKPFVQIYSTSPMLESPV